MRSPRRCLAPLVALFFGCTPESVGCTPRGDEAEPSLPSARDTSEAAPRAELPPLPDLEVAGETVIHELFFPEPSTHYVEVRSTFPAEGDALELFMPVWTPGSYLVREYARQVESEGATTPDGARLVMEKTRKNRWRVSGEGALPTHVVVRYRVYAREASVRTSFVDPDVGVLNGASLFLAPVGRTELAQEVRLTPAPGWARCVSALDAVAEDAEPAEAQATEAQPTEAQPTEAQAEAQLAEAPPAEAQLAEAQLAEAQPAEAQPAEVQPAEAQPAEAQLAEAQATEPATLRFSARDFDTLVDSPVVCGAIDVREWQVNDVPHVLATVGGQGVWDDERAAADLERIVRAQHAFWGVVPYRRYVFFNVLLGGGGGLEHAASTMMMGDRWDARDEADYRGWLGLASHELFHTWNVKRLRPEVLGPRFDYEHETYLRDLWIVEGVTSYYDDLLVHRAGLTTREQYLALLSKQIQRLQETPGRHVQSLADASFDTWIKYYRPDEHARSSRVSYYTKGAIVAFLLDAELRAQGRSLDEVMRLAYERFGESGYSREGFRALVTEVAGTDLSTFFAHTVDDTIELDYDRALAFYGLRFRPVEANPRAHLGADVASEGGRLIVREVPAGTPAFAAGLQVEDELLAIDDERLPTDLDARLARLRAGDEVELLIARRGRLRQLSLTLGTTPVDTWQLEVDPSANVSQRRALDAWLPLP